MSKKHGHRKKRRHKKHPPAPYGPLEALAAALNSCERAGLHVRFPHGIVFTDAGVIVPRKGRWVARAFVTTGDTPDPGPDDLDD